MCIRDSADDALGVLQGQLHMVDVQQDGDAHLPVSYTHLDVYKRQSQINDIDMAFAVHLQHICTFIVRHIYQSG